MGEHQKSQYFCYLSDSDGHPLYPCAEGAIEYRNLSANDNAGIAQQYRGPNGVVTRRSHAVLAGGWVTAYSMDGAVQRTLRFDMLRCVRLCGPKTNLSAHTLGFACHAQPVLVATASGGCAEHLRVWVRLAAAAVQEQGGCAVFEAQTVLFCAAHPLRGESGQFTAFAQETQRVFTDADKAAQYDPQPIPEPCDITFGNVFVNASLQPDVNYSWTQGEIALLTRDAPQPRAPVEAEFERVWGQDGCLLRAAQNYYVAVGNGSQTVFTDADGLPQYGGGILPPESVTFYRLFVNGVLQPKAVYELQEGRLRLTEPPAEGRYLVLEAVSVYAR